MRHLVTVAAVAIGALALIVAAANGGRTSAVHEHSEWEQVVPPVMASDFTEDAAAMAVARMWAEACRDNDWVGAGCMAPKVPYRDEGVTRAAAAAFDAMGATVEFREGTGGFIEYRYVAPHGTGATPTPEGDGADSGGGAAPASPVCPIDCLNGVDQGISCQNMCSIGGGRPFLLVCRPGVTYYRIDGGALSWTSGSTAGLRALYGDRFALASECHGP